VAQPIVQKENADALPDNSAPSYGRASADWLDRRVLGAIQFFVLFAAIWMVLDICYQRFPLIRPGADVVMDAKFNQLVSSPLFVPSDRVRIFVFGNSRTMAGFVPADFDAALGSGVRSYNLGLPGDSRFLPILSAALKAGNIPTHLFLTLSWPDQPTAPTWLDRLRDEETIMYTLIPFHDLPRDVVTFVAGSHMDLRHKYEQAGHERSQMLNDRGWYFISSQSLFPDQKLPAGFALPSDHPTQFDARPIAPRSYIRQEVEKLAEEYHFKIIFIPANLRQGAQAPAPDSTLQRNVSLDGNPGERVIGPDYWVYPPDQFSDPVHMNPKGAAAYTRQLAQLMKQSGALN
jgi:hypothetical protein